MTYQKKYLPLILGVAIAIGIFIGGKLSSTGSSGRMFAKNSKKEKLNRLIDYIDYKMYDKMREKIVCLLQV